MATAKNAYPPTINDRAVTNTLNQVNGRLINLYPTQTSYVSTSYSLNVSASQYSNNSKSRISQVRRTLILIVTFDLIFMALLWIIYNQIRNIPIDEAFKFEVLHYSIKTSLFDIVGLSLIRFILLIIPYAILKWSHWIFAAFTTLGSTGFIIAKTCVFTIGKIDQNSTDYIILIASFILTWVEIWFFDYRVIPHERRLREAVNQGERQPLLSESISQNPTVLDHLSIPTPDERHQSFYSATHSIDGSEIEESPPVRTIRSDSNVSQSMLGTPISSLDYDNNEIYTKQADDLFDEILRIYKDDKSWSNEAKSTNGRDIVTSKNVPNRGKVFRLIGTITGTRADIIDVLFERQEDIPKWSPTVQDCRILEVINSDLYITYQLANAQPFISQRDFVNLSARRSIDNFVMLVAQASVHPRMPPKDNCIRAETRLTGYILDEIDETTFKFTWFLNVDLKGWIPQYIINSALANAQLDILEQIRNYISKTFDITSSSSSSIGN